jgi:hypothetical protein
MSFDSYGSTEGESQENAEISEEEQREVRKIMRIFHRYKKNRSKYDRNWMHYYKMFRGDQWERKRPRYRHSEVVNFIFQSIQSSVPLQTDVRPQITYIPQDPTDREFAEILNLVSESDWDRNNWLAPLTEVIFDAYLYGTGFSSMNYDPEADLGLGSAVYQSEDPFYCYPDPDARDVNDPNSKGLIHAEPMCTDVVKRMAGPERAHLIKPDVQDLVRSSKTSLNDLKLRQVNTDRDMPDVTFESTAGEGLDNRTMVITAYLKPDELEEIETEETDENGEVKKLFVLRKRYPDGRKVVIANGVIIEDGPLPYAHQNIPFSRYVNYILPREFFGISEVEQLESPQVTFNKLLNFTLDYLTLMGNPIWVVDTAANIDTDNLVNSPGLIVEKEPGSEVRREAGVQLQPFVLQLIDRMQSWFNDIAGTQDVTRGATPGSVTAAAAIEQLQEAARTRIRQKQRNLDDYIRDFGRQYTDIVMENYTTARVFRVTNDQGSSKYFKFSTKRSEETGGQLVATFQKFDDQGRPEGMPQDFMVSGRFDVKVNTGSSLPFTVADRENKALSLFDRGIIDVEEVLNVLDYPNKEQVLVRIQEQQAQAAQAAEQQGAQ